MVVPAGQPRAALPQPHRRPRRRAGKGEITYVCVPITVDDAHGRRAGRRRCPTTRTAATTGRSKFFGIVGSMIGQAMRVHRLVEAERKRLVEENTQAPAGAEGALRHPQHRRQQPAHAAGLRAGGAGGAHQHDRAHARRVGHGQGAGRARHPLRLAARGQAVRQGELRRAAREPHRVGAVRLRAGRLHRRARRRRRAASSWPTAAPSSWTRWAS